MLSERSSGSGWTESLLFQARETSVLIGLHTRENSLPHSGSLGRKSGSFMSLCSWKLPGNDCHPSGAALLRRFNIWFRWELSLPGSYHVLSTLSIASASCFPERTGGFFTGCWLAWSSPSVADCCPSPGRGMLSIMTRCCCWYFIYYRFIIAENHFIRKINIASPVRSIVFLLTFLLKRSAWSWSQFKLDLITPTVCVFIIRHLFRL